MGRLVLAWALVSSIGSAVQTAVGWLAIVVAADLMDGWLARRWGVDTDRRRIADTVVDRLSINAAFIAAAVHWPMLWVWCLPLLARDLLAAAGYIHAIVSMRTVIVGDGWHKISGATAALFGLAVLAGPPQAIPVCASLAIAANWTFLIDHIGTYLNVRGVTKAVQPNTLTRRTSHGWTGVYALMMSGATSSHLPR
jgi:CDP-diacylglycerol--glycerol-3-phosphate 3-phosphatidyltransferase